MDGELVLPAVGPTVDRVCRAGGVGVDGDRHGRVGLASAQRGGGCQGEEEDEEGRYRPGEHYGWRLLIPSEQRPVLFTTRRRRRGTLQRRVWSLGSGSDSLERSSGIGGNGTQRKKKGRELGCLLMTLSPPATSPIHVAGPCLERMESFVGPGNV